MNTSGVSLNIPTVGKLHAYGQDGYTTMLQGAAQAMVPATHNQCDRARRRSDRGKTALGDVLNHFESTGKGESGIRMGVNSAGLLEMTGRLAIPSFSNPVQMDTSNLLGLHS